MSSLLDRGHVSSRLLWPKIRTGPSDNGGWWLRVWLAESIAYNPYGKAEIVALAIYGWGFDKLSPFSFVPRFFLERRKGNQVLSWFVWMGFFFATQTALNDNALNENRYSDPGVGGK